MMTSRMVIGNVLLFMIFLLALSLRLFVLVCCVDIPGDGPTHAWLAYMWYQIPHAWTHGNWLPGLTLIGGLFSYIIDNPLWSIRILNVLLGLFSIPIYYILVKMVYGVYVSLISAIILAVIPLHVGLSSSSLTEASFCFEVLAGMLFLISGAERQERNTSYLVLACFFFGLASMIRYEGWLFIFLGPLYYFVKTRNAFTTAVLGCGLGLMPSLWMMGNYVFLDDFMPPIHGTLVKGPETAGASPVGFVQAIEIIGEKVISHLGLVLVGSIVGGLMLETVQLGKGNLTVNRALWLAVFVILWTVVGFVAMARGESLWDRYLLFGMLMGIPLGAFFVNELIKMEWKMLGLSIYCALALAAMGTSVFAANPELYVTRKKPHAIRDVASWASTSSFSDDAILLTDMEWQGSYFPLYAPEFASRIFIMSEWLNNSQLERFIRNERPSLLITSKKDIQLRLVIEAMLGTRLAEERLIKEKGFVQVYSLYPYKNPIWEFRLE